MRCLEQVNKVCYNQVGLKINMDSDMASVFVLDTDIQVVSSKTAEEILEESANVAQTDGEWELIKIEIAPAPLEITDGKYSQIKYNVCA